MPPAQLSSVDHYYLRQRSKIETLFSLIKESYSDPSQNNGQHVPLKIT